MKKIISALAFAAAIALSLTGCEKKELSDEYVTIKQYKGLQVPKTEVRAVTDEMTDRFVQSLLYKDRTREEIKDRPAQDGDTVVIDFTGSIDGVEFAGGAAKDSELKLGSGSFIGATDEYKGFEEQVAGHNTGEEFDITVQFPSEYKNNPEMENKVAVFHIVLHKIIEEKLPEFTDEWVQKNSDTAKTKEEFKKEIRAKLEKKSIEEQKAALSSAAITALLDKTEVKAYPEGAVEKIVKDADEYYKNYAKAYDMEFEDFCVKMLGKSKEEYDKAVKESAGQMLKAELACKLIAKKEKIEPSKEEYDRQIAAYAKNSGYNTVKEFIDSVGEEEIKNMIRQQVVGKFLAEHCVQAEK